MRIHGLVVAALTIMAGLAGAQKAAVHAGAMAHEAEPTGPTVVIDTTGGRLTCRLYAKEAPAMTANFIGLATGTKPWKDGATGRMIEGEPFYDGNSVYGMTEGIAAGDRLGGNNGLAGDPFPEEKTGLDFRRPGRLAMAVQVKDGVRMTSSSNFYVTAYGYDGAARRPSEIFGQCDQASIAVADRMRHELLSTDNHPQSPLGIDHIAVVEPGQAAPAAAAHIAPESLTPQFPPLAPPLIPAPEPTGPKVAIETTMGTLNCRLFKETPVATETFIGLATGTKTWKHPKTGEIERGKRFYDGLSFARVIPDFMVQNAEVPGGGRGGDIGFVFDVELVPGLTYDRPGRLAFANRGPGTNASQFYVTEHPVSRLNGDYTIFGQCDDATVKVVEAIARVPRDGNDKPLKPVVIRTVKIEK